MVSEPSFLGLLDWGRMFCFHLKKEHSHRNEAWLEPREIGQDRRYPGQSHAARVGAGFWVVFAEAELIARREWPVSPTQLEFL